MTDFHDNLNKLPNKAVYLTNTYKKTKGVVADLMVFKIFDLKTSEKSYLLVEAEPRPSRFEITNIMFSKHKEKFEKIYRVNLNKNLMNTQCFFAGKEVFPNSFSAKCIFQLP